MNSNALITRIADQADDFLEGVTSREQARAAISEMVTIEDSSVPPDTRNQVVDGVMQLLEREGFFEGTGGGRSADEADDSEEE